MKNKSPEELRVDKLFIDNVNNIVPVDLESEMKSSFIDYAMSVITDRALPDVRDGLKPVHRRILYSMFTQGFTPDKAYRKCATTVGDVLGRFHPHGDASVYDALVRLAQDFSMREMLVDGHGNFGSRDGDSPAAYRYTEARLAKISMELMSDINKNTVDFRPNFDEHDMEPVVLPARFPNLLVNGSIGIAVGMATNIPPHNLAEVIDASIFLLNNDEASVDELMQFIKGPDFPTAAKIMGRGGIRQVYETGKGRILVRSDCEIEEMHAGRFRIVVRDLPYMVNKAKLILRIADLVKEKRLDGISFIRDESDRKDPVRIVIELKRDANPNVVLNQLYTFTQLQDSFSANLLALVPDACGTLIPRQIGLKEALSYYIDHQRDVLKRRSAFELEKALTRAHIVEGLQIAIDNIDRVINIIRSSHTEEEAKLRLGKEFSLSERQTQHIVDMRLGRLTGLEREKLDKELSELNSRIERLRTILSDASALNNLLEEELTAIKEKYKTPRLTVIEDFAEDITDESLIKEEDIVITLTHYGYIKRLPADTYQMQHRGGRGISGLQMKEDDFVKSLITASTHSDLLFFTNTGRVFKLKAYMIPEAGRHARGTALVNLLQLVPDERVVNILPIESLEEEGSLIFATKKGLVKKTGLSDYANINKAGIYAINLREGDSLIGTAHVYDKTNIMLLTEKGQLINFESEQVRDTGRRSYGVKGISLRKGDRVISMQTAEQESTLLFVSEKGYGKRCAASEFRAQNRGGMGLKAYTLNKKTGNMAGFVNICEDDDLVIINDKGIIIRIDASEISELGRYASGVKLMNNADSEVVDFATANKECEDDESAEAEVTQSED